LLSWHNANEKADKGFDVVYVDDISATVSGDAAYGMVRYNADLNGFIGNSTGIVGALRQQMSA